MAANGSVHRSGRLIGRSSLRHFTRHPLQAALAILGIALGVGIVIAVDLATSSARTAFELTADAVFGRATHQVLPGPAGIPDSIYRRIRVETGVQAAPIVELFGRIVTADASRDIRVLGVDAFAERPFRSWLDLGPGGSDVDLAGFMTRPGAIVLPAQLASELGLSIGDSLRVEIAGTLQTAWLAGELAPADALSRRALADIAIADIATAQELGDRIGTLDRIDLRLPDDHADRALVAIRSLLPAGAQIVESAARTQSTAAMTRAFELNLAAFALITLVFAALLIYGVMTFSVVQRRELIGLLRAMGVTRREVAGIVLREAFVMGVLATILGSVVGVVLRSGLVRLVTRTINDLYFSVAVTGVHVAPGSLLKGALLGIGATVAASLPALREATATAPRFVLVRSTLEAGARTTATRTAWLGALLLVPAALLILLTGHSVVPGFAALFAVVGAAALLAPITTVLLMRAVRPVAASLFGMVGSMAVRGVPATLSRTAPAIAALMVAVAIGGAVTTLIGSFRDSVEAWLDESLQADVYVASASAGSRGEGTLDPRVIDAAGNVAGIAGITTYRHADVVVGDVDVRLVAVDLYERHRSAFTFIEGDPAGAWPAFENGSLLVSEAFAFRNDVGPGDTLSIAAGREPHTFRVAAVFRDYSSEFGVLFIDRAAYDRLWKDDGVSSLGVFAAEGVDADSLIVRLRTATSSYNGLFLRSNRGLRDATLEVFDRTFAITGVLRMLALIVAFVAVLSSLMALQLERRREIAMLRAIGLTPGQVSGLVLSQTGLLGLAAGTLAAPLSVALAWLLINVVNRRSFGWSIRMHADLSGLAEAVALAVTAALLAGLYPAWKMSRTPPGVALRNE